MANTAKDYLAVISNGGVGSWARFPDKAKAIAEVARRFKSDYCGVFKLPKGTKVTIDVVEVTGHNTVWWDANYFYDGDVEDKSEPHRLNRPVEKIQHTY
jgi:hypothetical protein